MKSGQPRRDFRAVIVVTCVQCLISIHRVFKRSVCASTWEISHTFAQLCSIKRAKENMVHI